MHNLGSRKKRSIPIEIKDDTGDVVREEGVVFEKWRCDVHDLHNCAEHVSRKDTK